MATPSGTMYEDLVNTMGDDIAASLEVGGDDPLTHGLGSVLHTSATLAQLNTLVSDATLDTSTAQRTPLGTGMAALTAKATPVAADILAIADTDAANVSKKVTIGTLPIAPVQIGNTVNEVASDGAAALVTTDTALFLAASASGNKEITTSSSHAGQKVNIFLLAASGGDYHITTEDGTITFDAALECAVIARTDANDAWKIVGLSNATIV